MYEQISTGILRAGQALPTERALTETYHVSRQTVRNALKRLHEDNLIYSVQGSGTFVKSDRDNAPVHRRIIVMMTYLSEYIFPSMLQGINQVAFEKGYAVEIKVTNNSVSTERDILLQISENPIDGIIAEGTKAALPNPNTHLYRKLSEKGIPIIFINSIYPNLNSDRILSVTTADYDGGRLLAEELIRKGHRSIGCIFKSDDAQGIQRYFGFISALAASSVNYNDHYFIWYTSETKNTLQMTLTYSTILTDCSAIVCYNDEVAAIVCSCLRRMTHNIKVILSFDRNINPDLIPEGVLFYSLSHPRSALGSIAAEKLINMLEGKPETSVILPWGE